MRKKEYVLMHSISANLVHGIRSKLGKKNRQNDNVDTH